MRRERADSLAMVRSSGFAGLDWVRVQKDPSESGRASIQRTAGRRADRGASSSRRPGRSGVCVTESTSTAPSQLGDAGHTKHHRARSGQCALGIAEEWLVGPDALECVADAQWKTTGDDDLTGVTERIMVGGARFEALPHEAGASREAIRAICSSCIRSRSTDARHTTTATNRARLGHPRTPYVRPSFNLRPTVIYAQRTYASWHSDGRRGDRALDQSASTRIALVGGRIVSSVVLRDARVFRDFLPSPALRLRAIALNATRVRVRPSAGSSWRGQAASATT